MSIFSWLVSIEVFIQKLLGAIKKDYLNLEPGVKSLLDGAIKFGNAAKGYIANPGSDGIVAGDFITIIEDELGTGLTAEISGVVGEVNVDLGIVDAALTDPGAAYQQLLTHLSSLKGKAFADALFNTVQNIALRITHLTDNNEVKAIIAVAYQLFFSGNPPVAIPEVATPSLAVNTTLVQ